MRPIKFRAWHKETKKMIDLQRITPLALSDSMNTQLSLQGISGLFIPFRKDMPLMQYTGLKDKNGKEIYEGDIVKWDSKVGVYQYVISWDKPKMGWNIPQRIYEVIGNIYENKEPK